MIPPVTELSFFSDCWPKPECNCCCNAPHMNPTLKTINLKFLELGHTHMECDSMHATTEAAIQVSTVYCPREWQIVIELAKWKDQPYELKIMLLKDFLDIKGFKQWLFVNPIKCEDGGKLTGETSNGFHFWRSSLMFYC